MARAWSGGVESTGGRSLNGMRAGSRRAGSTPPGNAVWFSGTMPEIFRRGPTISPASTLRRTAASAGTSLSASSTVVNPASMNDFISAGSAAPTCRCASMKPGITVRPPASTTLPEPAGAAPARTERITPPSTTMVPLAISPPAPSRMRALVTTKFCAHAAVETTAPQRIAKRAASGRFILLPFIRRMRLEP